MSRIGKSRENCDVFPVLASLLAVTAFHVLFMVFSGKGLLSPNPYNSYAKQAAAWARGQLDLGQDFPWLELAVYQGRYYVSFPPFPSYVLFPFALFLGENTPDSLFAFFSLLLGTAYASRLAAQLGLDRKMRTVLPVFLFCCNNLWQITVDGWVWFLAQNFSFTLTLAAFSYALDGKKGRALFCLCAAVGCRPFQILYFPWICLLLLRQNGKNFKQLLGEKAYRFLPAVGLAFSFFLLNFLRFGNPFEFGHNYLPEFVHSQNGQFSFSYLGENLYSLVRLPTLEGGRMQFPQFNGCSVFLVYPILWLWLWSAGEKAWGLKASGGGKALRALLPDLAVLLSVSLHLLLFCCHKTMGGAHFGNRYPADAMPLVYLITLWDREQCRSASSGPVRFGKLAGFTLLAAWGLVINFAGVLNFYASAS